MKRIEISEEQQEEIKAARKKNRDKKVEKRLQAIELRGEGKTREEIQKVTGFTPEYISSIIKRYTEKGMEAITGSHYKGNRRNLSYEEEEKILFPFKEKAEAGQIVEVGEIKAAYIAKVGHSIGNGQIYYVLKRHGWRKVMPRSQHPNKASEEAIDASKKLSLKSWNWLPK